MLLMHGFGAVGAEVLEDRRHAFIHDVRLSVVGGTSMETLTAKGPEANAGQHGYNLKFRHASALTKLMEERQDLRGVHVFADFVDDSVRWSA